MIRLGLFPHFSFWSLNYHLGHPANRIDFSSRLTWSFSVSKFFFLRKVSQRRKILQKEKLQRKARIIKRKTETKPVCNILYNQYQSDIASKGLWASLVYTRAFGTL